MAAIILIKRSDSDGKPSSLSRGELAYAFGAGTDSNDGQRLFIGDSSNVLVIGGEYFTKLLDHAPGTLTASSAIITDGNNKIDQLKVDLLTLDSDTISTESGNLLLSSNTGIVELGNLEFENNEIRTNSNTQTLIINPYPTNDSGTVIIKGDLRVDGTTTTINSTEITVNDKTIIVADSGGSVRSDFDNSGLIVFSADSTTIFGTNAPSILYDATSDVWDFSRSITVNGINIGGDISFTDSSLKTFLDSDDFVFNSGIASIKEEAIEDIVGAMVEGNTETNITVTYQDTDGTIDFEVPTATTDQVGVAQFDSNEFDVAAGFVTIDTIDGGTY